jgi:hypothetical protein
MKGGGSTASPAIPAAESALGSLPSVALSSARVAPACTNSTVPRKLITADPGPGPSLFCRSSTLRCLPIPDFHAVLPPYPFNSFSGSFFDWKMLTPMKTVIRVSTDDINFLANLEPPVDVHKVLRGAERRGGLITAEQAHVLSDFCCECLASFGFDLDYEPTPVGSRLEELIDRLFAK